MAKPWSEVAASSGFKSLPPEQQDGARRQYFDDVVAPQVPASERETVWGQFSTEAGMGRRELPAGVAPSTAGGGRGSVNPDSRDNAQPSRAQRIAEMDDATNPANPNYLPVTDNAVKALQADGRQQMDSRRTNYPGRVLDKNIPGLTPLSAAQDVAAGALQIIPTAAKGVGDIARLVTGDRVGKGLSEYAESSMDAARQVVGSERAAAQKLRFEQDMTDPALNAADVVVGNPGALADQVLPTVGSMALPVGVAAAAGKVATSGRAAQLASVIDEATVLARANKAREAAAIGATVVQNAGDTYSTIRDKGGEQDAAYLGAAITAPVTYVAGRLTGGGAEGQAAKLLAGQKGAITAIPKGMLREGVQEMGEEVGQYTGETVGTGEEFDANTAGKRLAVAGTLGAAMGGGVDAAGAASALRQGQIKRLRDAGETATADLMQQKHDKAMAAESVDGELQRMPGNPAFQASYRQMRTAGVKPAEAAARSAVTTSYQGLAATAGIPEKAAAAALEKAATLPLDQVPGFFAKFTAGLANRGLVQPFDGMDGMAAGLEAARDDAIEAAMGAAYQPAHEVRQAMDDVMALEAAQDRPEQELTAATDDATDYTSNASDVLATKSLPDSTWSDKTNASEAPESVRPEIDEAAHAAATSHLNELPEPTQAQKEAGNYRKGHINIHGLDIAIENPKGSTRSGVSPDGTEWSNTMGGHYGYFKGTTGNDQDHVDTYVGHNPDSNRIFVIDQVNGDGSFDEHKVMAAYDTPEQARGSYLSSFMPGWTGLGAMTELPVQAFKSWVKDGIKKKPLGLLQPPAQPAASKAMATINPGDALQTGDETRRAEILRSQDGLTGSTRAANLNYMIEQAEQALQGQLKHPFPNKASQDETVADWKQKIGDYQVILPAAEQADRTDQRKGIDRSMLQGAKAELDVAVESGDMSQQEAQDAIEKARATGNSVDASESILKAVDAKATLSPDGTLSIKGNAAAIKAQLADAGLTGIPMKGGMQVGRRQAAKAQAVFEPKAPIAQAGKAQAATNSVAPDGPSHLGRNNQPLSEGGKPFKTRLAASDAKKLQPMMRVVSVKDGFALTEKTEKQLAAEAKAARRLRNPQTSLSGEPIPAHAFIAAEGGLHSSTKSDMGMEGNVRIGNRSLFSGAGKGLTIERATMRLIEEGYLSENSDHEDARNLIKRSLTQPQYTADGVERIAEAEAQAEFEAYALAQENAVAEVESLDDNEFDFLEDSDIPFGDVPSNTSTEAAMRSMGFTEQEIQDAIAQESGISPADSESRSSPGETANRQAQGSDERGTPAPEQEQGGLTAPSQQDVLDQQDRAGQADQLDAKAQIDREAKGQTLTRQVAPGQRKDNSGDMFAMDKAQAEIGQRNTGRAAKADPNQSSMFDEPAPAISQADTPAFNQWFKGSKVVDAAGRPLVMYHGTSASEKGEAFTSFDTYASSYGLMGMGGYFTADPAVASNYTTKGKGATPTVYKAFLSIKNPLDMDAKASASAWKKQFDGAEAYHEGGTTNESWYRAAEASLSDEGLPMYEGAEIMQDGLRAMGFDGITHIGGGRVKSDGVKHRVYIAFEPEQAKSATGNNGDFSKADPRMAFARGEQADTPAFKRWFGESEIVDADGLPQVVYHGTNVDFAAFSTDKAGSSWDAGKLGEGFYFSTDPRLSSSYAQNSKAKTREDAPLVMPVYVAMQNPLEIGPIDWRRGASLWDKLRDYSEQAGIKEDPVSDPDSNQPNPAWSPLFRDALKRFGYDGVVLKFSDGHKEIVAFDPAQVKSATGNNGDFDPANPDITLARNMDAEAFRRMFSPPSAMPIAEVQKIVDELSAKWQNGPAVKVVQTPADLPVRAPSDVRGFVHKGTAYIVASNNPTRDWVARTLAHEAIGHHGLWAILGDEGAKRFSRNVQLAVKSGNVPLNKIAAKVRRLYVDEKGNFNLSAKQESDEIAAFAVEDAVDPKTGEFKPGYGFVKEVYAKLAAWLRDTIGIKITFTMTELHGMLVSAMRGLETGKRLEGGGRSAAAFSFAGERAQTVDAHELTTARQRLDAGENAEKVRKATGWSQGADGKMRFEISDKDALLKAELDGPNKYKTIGRLFTDDYFQTLGSVLHHPALFAAYPALVGLPIKFVSSIMNPGVKGAFGKDGISINSDASPSDALSTMLHEIQHGIQDVEGFATGGSPAEFGRKITADRARLETVEEKLQKSERQAEAEAELWIAKYPSRVDEAVSYLRKSGLFTDGEDSIDRDAVAFSITEQDRLHQDWLKEWRALRESTKRSPTDSYRRLAGEVEARNTQARASMTDAERRATSPEATADVKADDVIVTFNDKEMLNAPAPENSSAFARGIPAPGPGLFQPTVWNMPDATKTDRIIYELQDGKVDLKRVQQAITKSGQQIEEKWDARLAETLYPGRVAYRSQTFLEIEAKPLLEAMTRNNVPMNELADYLHARGAEERNKQIAKVNPAMPDGGAGTNTRGVLLTTQAARDYLANVRPARKVVLDAMAKRVDTITAGTRKLLATEGLEKQETIDAWEGAYKNYVPMFRDEAESAMPPHPQGSGFAVKGSASKRATGSTKEVTNILAHVLMQREAAITRAEKNRVALALYGQALSHPNPAFWTTIKPGMSAAQIGAELVAMGVDPLTAQVGMQGVPTITTVDKPTGKVVSRANPMYQSMPGAIPLKVNGEDRVLMLNVTSERGQRLAESLKNMDGLTAIEWSVGLLHKFVWSKIPANVAVGPATRWLAAVNTQYNPAFGLVNLTRDTLGGAINLGSTELRGNALKVLAKTPAAILGIARELASGGQSGKWQALYRQFQEDGGQTGFKENFRDPDDRAKAIEKELASLGRGMLSPGRATHFLLDLLDGFNTSLENAVRLSAYSEALGKGMSRANAARLGRELTVDFNRKGRAGREVGPLYAFFNASVQGSARTLAALKGPTGWKIIAGGLGMGVLQAMMLAAAGYDDDEIPEFVKTRALIIPMFGKEKTYISIPYPLGLHVIPNTGRVLAELVLSGGKDILNRSKEAIGEIAGAFNPMGGANILTADGALKTMAPTLIDPVIELGFNRNFAGGRIEKEGYGGESDNRPGVARTKEATQRSTTGQVYMGISKAINTLSGGTDYEKGAASPTPERVRYLAQTVGGGVLREIEKTVNASTATARGEKVKMSQIPVAGRFYGEVDDDQVQMSRYYDSSSKLKTLESSFKAMTKAGDSDAARKFMDKHPELVMGRTAAGVQQKVAALNKLAVQTVSDPAMMKQIDEARVANMAALNQALKAQEDAAGKPTLTAKLREAVKEGEVVAAP